MQDTLVATFSNLSLEQLSDETALNNALADNLIKALDNVEVIQKETAVEINLIKEAN